MQSMFQFYLYFPYSSFCNSAPQMHGTTAPAAGATNPNGGGENGGGGGGSGNNSLDPFTRKSSVKKLGKHPKKQQGSSRFRNQPHVEIQPLSLLKGLLCNSLNVF